MTFRDDHAAAVARAHALQVETERANAERDELAAKVTALESELDSRPPARNAKLALTDDDSLSPRSRRIVWIFVIVFALVVGAIMAIVGFRDRNQHRAVDAWHAKHEARNAHGDRWRALTSVEPCLRDVAYNAVFARRGTPDKADPRVAQVPSPERLAANCLSGAGALVDDSATAPVVREALRAWLAVQQDLVAPAKALGAYYSNNDWTEDNFASAPARWAPLLALLERQVEVIARVRREALPEITNEMRRLQKQHESQSQRDETWWRIEIALALRAINDRTYEVSGIYAGKEPDDNAAAAAVRDQVVTLLATAEDAPIEVRRILRHVDYITQVIAAGKPLLGETPLWHLDRIDSELMGAANSEFVPAVPPEPGPRPPDPND